MLYYTKDFSLNFLYYTLIIVGVIGVFSPTFSTYIRYNILPTVSVFEILFFFSTFACISGGVINKRSLNFSLITCFYILVSILFACLINKVHVLDFLLAYKAFIYVPMLCLAVNKRKIDKKFISSLLNILLILFFIKYSYSVFLGLDSRPGLYHENNYELIFLLLIYYLNFIFNKEQFKIFPFIVIFIIILLSGSRSSFLAFTALHFCIFFLRNFSWKTIVYILAAFLLLFGMLFIWFSRLDAGPIEEIDRFVFLQCFLHDISDWKWWQFLTGSPRLTPLSSYSCNMLSYYQYEFSFSGDNSCYSVILHSYLMRVIFDHGILGLFFLLFFIYYSMKDVGFTKIHYFSVIIVILITGLSVSSLNNAFINLALFFIFAADYEN